MIHIRKAEEQDLHALRSLFHTIRSEEFPWEQHIEDADFDISTQGESVYAAETDDEIVGFISIWEEDCFVHNLFVARQARSKGVGAALLQYVRAQHPSKIMTLKCVQENRGACRFYLKQGWTVLETVDDEVPYYKMQWVPQK